MLKLHNVRMKPLIVRKKKKETTKCDKSIVTCDVGTIQCENGTVKCDILITQYSRLLTSGYCTHFLGGGSIELPIYEQTLKLLYTNSFLNNLYFNLTLNYLIIKVIYFQLMVLIGAVHYIKFFIKMFLVIRCLAACKMWLSL